MYCLWPKEYDYFALGVGLKCDVFGSVLVLFQRVWQRVVQRVRQRVLPTNNFAPHWDPILGFILDSFLIFGLGFGLHIGVISACDGGSRLHFGSVYVLSLIHI